MGFAEQGLAHHRDLEAAFTRFDDRTQPRAAGTDHDYVVGVPFDLNHETSLSSFPELAFQPMNLKCNAASLMVPLATSAM